jgi:hypothetical protein
LVSSPEARQTASSSVDSQPGTLIRQRIGNKQDANRVRAIMRSVCCAVGVALFACNIAGFAETKIPCSQTMSRPMQSRAVLIIDSKPAGLQIVGTDREAIHVSCTAGNDETARDIAFHFSSTANGGKLSIENAHFQHGNNNVEIRIEVPRRTNLSIRMFAGEVRVEEVKGDKDIDLGAGQITISSIHDGDYRSVNASVSVGAVQARAFGANKGGFFRSFSRKNSSGDYRLQAHVTTGEIDLLGNAEQKSEGAKPD